MENLDKIIIDLIRRQEFARGLFEINEQFYYLKQETYIRDLLLKSLNSTLVNALAIAEHPKSYVRTSDGAALNMGRRDIGLFGVNDGRFDTKEPIYSIEVKFYFPLDLFKEDFSDLGDRKHHRTDLGDIRAHWNRDIYNNKTDCLMLIICERDWVEFACIADSPSRNCAIDLVQQQATLRKKLAAYITDLDCDFSNALRTSIKSPTNISADATTRYTFLLLFRR
ncbi:hypothetical protein [Cellvibrio mixtus]|uniref:hypothetical protein n=1 Tax=Cellvibrio mixtus TaxID=39650 RepID=UPI0005875952|nr:hypothetical protein [Cellvibrio mixtus]